MTPEPDPAAPAPAVSPEADYARVVAERDQARAEHREVRRDDAITRLAAAAGADPERLADSRAFTDAYADLGRDPSDSDVAAAIDATLAAQPSLRTAPLAPAGRPPRAARAQGSAEITARTTTDRRAAENADQSPTGRITAELRRAADRKAGTHR